MNIKIDFNNLKYIFIDFDGTLVDTVPILFDNYSKFLRNYGKVDSLEEFQSLMGPSIDEFILILKERHNLSHKPEELINIYTHGLAARYAHEAKLLPGSRKFLDYIMESDLEMALVTSTAYPLIEECLENLKLKKYFKHIITGDKVKKTKPDPEIYLLALKSCIIHPQEALTIEDSTNGILASLGAGIPTLAIQNKYLVKVPEKAMQIKSWDDLLKMFRAQYGKYH